MLVLDRVEGVRLCQFVLLSVYSLILFVLMAIVIEKEHQRESKTLELSQGMGDMAKLSNVSGTTILTLDDFL